MFFTSIHSKRLDDCGSLALCVYRVRGVGRLTSLDFSFLKHSIHQWISNASSGSNSWWRPAAPLSLSGMRWHKYLSHIHFPFTISSFLLSSCLHRAFYKPWRRNNDSPFLEVNLNVYICNSVCKLLNSAFPILGIDPKKQSGICSRRFLGASFIIMNNGKRTKCLITVASLKVWYSKILEYYTALKMVILSYIYTHIYMFIDMSVYKYRDLLFSGKKSCMYSLSPFM